MVEVGKRMEKGRWKRHRRMREEGEERQEGIGRKEEDKKER
jgi:hypothetical protein